MPVSRRRILLRRTLALLVVVAATAAVALVLGGGSGSSDPPRETGRSGVPPKVRKLLGRMSTEHRVDQVMAVGFAGTDSTSPVFERLQARQLGGIVVGASNWVDAVQGTELIAVLRDAAAGEGRVPPLIIAAQEGGLYRSFPDLPPGRRQLDVGDLGDPRLAQRWSFEAGGALKEAGFDLNLAPIADVATLDSPIADRAFGEDPDVVTRMTLAALLGCREAEIACAPAHFPGLGAASQDTDLGPATVGQEASMLLRRDLTPFRAAAAAGAPAMVLSHAFYAAFDPVTPGSQTRSLVTGLLRRRMGFEGVAITDDLDAGAIRALGSAREAAVASLVAGADLLLVEGPGRTQEAVRSTLLRAVKDRELSKSRLAEAAGRVLELKRRLGLLAN